MVKSILHRNKIFSCSWEKDQNWEKNPWYDFHENHDLLAVSYL